MPADCEIFRLEPKVKVSSNVRSWLVALDTPKSSRINHRMRKEKHL